MRRALRFGLLAGGMGWFWLGTVFLGWVVVPLLALTEPSERERRRRCQRVARRAFRLFHAYAERVGLIAVRVVGRAPALATGPAVIVANHPTLVDVTAILSTYDDICCVVRSDLFHNLFVGRAIRACGHIDAGDGVGLSGSSALASAFARLAEGSSILIFPEGTRSPPNDLRAFRRGGFEIAKRARVPLVPLFLTCTPPALSKGVSLWRLPEEVVDLCIQPCAAIDVAASGVPSRRLMQDVEADFRLRLDTKRLPLGVDPEPQGLEDARSVREASAANVGS